jgi:hypothetical protein
MNSPGEEPVGVLREDRWLVGSNARSAGELGSGEEDSAGVVEAPSDT